MFYSRSSVLPLLQFLNNTACLFSIEPAQGADARFPLIHRANAFSERSRTMPAAAISSHSARIFLDCGWLSSGKPELAFPAGLTRKPFLFMDSSTQFSCVVSIPLVEALPVSPLTSGGRCLHPYPVHYGQYE